MLLDTNDHEMSEDCQYERYALNTESGFNMDHHKVQSSIRFILFAVIYFTSESESY
jgi:hypothetical protein